MVTPGSRLIAFRRSSVDFGSVGAVLVTVLAVSALVSGVVASLPALQQESLRAAVRALPVEDTVVEVSSSYDAAGAAGQDRQLRALLEPVVATTDGAVVRRLETVGHRELRGDRTWSFLAVTGDDVLTAPAGRLPQDTADEAVEVAVSSSAAGAPAPGDRLTLASPLDDSRVDAVVVGSWQPVPEGRRAFGGSTQSSLLVAEEVFAELADRGARTTWRAAPAVERLRPGQLQELRAEVAGTEQAVAELAESLGTSIRVDNPLVEVLEARSRELTTQLTLLLAPALVLLLLGAAGAMLVAGALSESRSRGEGLLRSRGANLRQVAAPTLLEAVVICALAAGGGPLLASAVVRVGDVRPELDTSAWVGGAVAAAVCFVALAAPAVLRVVGGDRGEQRSVERRRRRLLTALLAGVLLMLALGLVAVVRLQGFAGTVAEGPVDVEPLMVAAPAMLLLALVTLLALVLLPVLFRVAEWAVRTRGVALVVGTRSATRAPTKAVPLALAVALAAGGIAFGVTERAGHESVREARAAHEVGSDIRVTAPPGSRRLGAQAERDRLSDLPGVTDVSAVHRELDFVDDVAAELLVAEVAGAVGRDLVSSSDEPDRVFSLLNGETAPSGDAVPMAATRDLTEDAALAVGDRIELTVAGTRTTLELAAVLPSLPTVTEGRAGVLVSRDAMLGHMGATELADAPEEWWLAAEDAEIEAVAVSLGDHPAVAGSVLTREQASRRLAADPGTGGEALTQVMGITAVGSLLIGGVFLCSVVVLRRRERDRQATVLRALGTTEREVTLTLGAEYAVTTGAGLVAGAVAGLLTAAVALRAMPLLPTAAAALPALPLDGGLLPALLGVLLAAPLLALAVLARFGGSRQDASLDSRWRP